MKLEVVSLGAMATATTTLVYGFNVCPATLTASLRTSTPVVRYVSAEPEERCSEERQFISILTEDGERQMLPTASASRFPLWVIEEGDAGRKQAIEVPGASEIGWVNPRRYVMPMVDSWVFKGGRKWRNRGLNTVPTARCWEPVARAAAGGLCISAYAEEKVTESETDSMWGTLAEKVPVIETIAEIVRVLADPPEGFNVEKGFHFVLAQMAGLGQMPVPACGGRVQMFLSDLPEPADLLELPEVTGVSELGFDVVAVASGAESEFLPEIYRAFFSAET